MNFTILSSIFLNILSRPSILPSTSFKLILPLQLEAIFQLSFSHLTCTNQLSLSHLTYTNHQTTKKGKNNVLVNKCEPMGKTDLIYQNVNKIQLIW